MDNPEFQQHGGPQAREHRPHRRPLHHTPFFWISVIMIFAAMTTYVLTNNLSSAPGHQAMPAIAP